MELPITNPALILAILAGSFLLVPIIFGRIRLPGIVGLILMGVLLGPKGFGLLERGEIFQQLGRAGLLYIIFVAALEIDLVRFKKYRTHSLIFGFLSFLIPQVVGAIVVLLTLGFELPKAILLASMFGSHTLLSYPIASRLGLSSNIAVTAGVGGTIITDAGAMLVLAIIAGSVAGGAGLLFWGQLVLSLTVFVYVALFVLPLIGRWFFLNVPTDGLREFLFVLCAMFTFSWLAQVAGVEAIIGAFLAGLALNPLIPSSSPLMSRIKFLGESSLIPIFLVSVGMLVDLAAVFSDSGALAVVVVMCGCVAVTKFAAAWLAGWWLRYSVAQRFLLFGLSVNQAAGTLAAVLVGFNLGIFDESVLNGTIIMILATCILGPSVTEKAGYRVVEESAEANAGDGTDAPQRILIPLSNPATAESLVDVALMIREPASKEPIYPLAVVVDGREVDARVEKIEKLLGVAIVRGASANVPMSPLTRVDANVAEGIRRALVEQRISTVVIGWNGQVSLASRIFGTVMDQMVSMSRQLVLVTRLTGPLNTTTRVVFAIPRNAMRESNFNEAVHTVKVMASQLTAPMLILVPPSERGKLEKRLTELRPEAAMQFADMPALVRLPEHLADILAERDLLVFLSVRDHHFSWTSEHDRVPRRLAEAFPNLSFAILFPSETGEDRLASASLSSLVTEKSPTPANSEGLIQPNQVLSSPEPIRVDFVLEGLLRESIGDNQSLVQRISENIINGSGAAPIELRDGVALMHCHVGEVPRPLLFVLASPMGVTVNGATTGGSYRVVFVLVSPTSLPAAGHLKILNKIAQLARNEETVSTVLEQRDSRVSADLLRKALD